MQYAKIYSLGHKGELLEKECAHAFLNFTFSFTMLTLAVFAVSSELWSLNNDLSVKLVSF